MSVHVSQAFSTMTVPIRKIYLYYVRNKSFLVMFYKRVPYSQRHLVVGSAGLGLPLSALTVTVRVSRVSNSVVRYPRYLDTYRRYLRDDTSIAKITIPRYIVAVQNTVKRHKYRAYRRYRAARIT